MVKKTSTRELHCSAVQTPPPPACGNNHPILDVHEVVLCIV